MDPLDTTSITNVEFDIDPNLTGGLPTGVYYYRVAPVLGNGDPANPDGEMLASERQPVRIPFEGIDLNLTWSAYPNASEYRIYRSPMADMNAGAEELLATVPASQTTFIDDGTGTTTAEAPLPLGSLGEWHPVGNLSTARHAHGLTAAQDPSDPGMYYLYAAGGLDSNGTALSSIEKISISVSGPRQQTVDTSDTSVTASLGVARYELSTLTATPQTASNLTSTYVYVLGGRSGGIGFSRATEVGEVTAGGDIAALTGVTDLQRQRAGYASAVANNNIVAACGQGGSPSNTADKMAITGADGTLGTSSALGDTGALRERYYPGYTSFTGLLYVGGGEDATDAASATVDYSILGGTP